MNMMQNTAAGTIRAWLRYPAFRRLLSALAVSQIGGWIHNRALVPLVCSWTHSAAWADVATVARVVPIVVLGPLGGAIADHFGQRLIMLVSDIARLPPPLLLALAAAAHFPIRLAPAIAAAITPYPGCVAAATSRMVDDADLPGADAAGRR